MLNSGGKTHSAERVCFQVGELSTEFLNWTGSTCTMNLTLDSPLSLKLLSTNVTCCSHFIVWKLNEEKNHRTKSFFSLRLNFPGFNSADGFSSHFLFAWTQIGLWHPVRSCGSDSGLWTHSHISQRHLQSHKVVKIHTFQQCSKRGHSFGRYGFGLHRSKLVSTWVPLGPNMLKSKVLKTTYLPCCVILLT